MLPYLIQIGSFAIPSYGLLVAVAFLAALTLASRFARERGVNSDQIVNLGVYCALTGMLGAKVLMIALDPALRTSLSEIFSLNTLQSAGIFFGGLITATVFAVFYLRAQGMPVLSTCDLFAPGVAIGHGIGRLGCFAAGCCWGKPTNLPWAVTFTRADNTTGVPLNIPLHPTQLYEALAEAIICLVLIWQLRQKKPAGRVIGLYGVLYGGVRFGVEFLREHDSSNPFGGPFVLEQWIALGLAAVGLLLVVKSFMSTGQPEPVPAG